MDGVRPAGALVQKALSGSMSSIRLFFRIRKPGSFSLVDVYLDLAAGHTIRVF